MFLIPRLRPRECGEAKPLRRCCVDVRVIVVTHRGPCATGMCHSGCRPQLLPTGLLGQGMWGTLGPDQVARISTSARPSLMRAECGPGAWLSLPWFPLPIPTLPAKPPALTVHQLHSHFLFSIPVSSFPIIDNGQRTRWKKRCS